MDPFALTPGYTGPAQPSGNESAFDEDVGAAVGENDLEVVHAPLQDKSMDHPRADESEWVVLLEGADVAAVGAAARSLFTQTRRKPFGIEAPPTIGIYRFLFGNQR